METISINELKTNAEAKVKAKLGVWYKVSAEAYLAAVTIAKEKYDDVVSESESMTTKSISMITALLVFIASFAGYFVSHVELLQKSGSIILMGFGGLFVCSTFIFLTMVIAPRSIYGKGVSPENIIPSRIDEKTNEKVQSQMIYLNYLVSLQCGIDYNQPLVESRAVKYTTGLYLFMITMLYIPIIAVYFIA